MSDYISREAAIEMLHYNAEESCASVVSDFETIPAADVAPVRHARWNIRLANESTLCLECSVCGHRVVDLHYQLEAGEYGEVCRRYPYCHCGAKMDLEVENDG